MVFWTEPHPFSLLGNGESIEPIGVCVAVFSFFFLLSFPSTLWSCCHVVLFGRFAFTFLCLTAAEFYNIP